MTNHFTYLNNGPMVKDLLFEHGGKKNTPIVWNYKFNHWS